jgi:DNA-binding response OmpR family regulator
MVKIALSEPLASPCDVLVVDDDDAIRATVAEVLRAEGYVVNTAANGAEALAVVDQVPPRLVLLDMRMPVLDGWGFVQGLTERGIRLRVLVLTATQDARRWAAEIGADGYIAKPFDLDDLLITVERLCNPEPSNGERAS